MFLPISFDAVIAVSQVKSARMVDLLACPNFLERGVVYFDNDEDIVNPELVEYIHRYYRGSYRVIGNADVHAAIVLTLQDNQEIIILDDYASCKLDLYRNAVQILGFPR